MAAAARKPSRPARMLTLRTDQFTLFDKRMFAALQAKVELAIAATFPELRAAAIAAPVEARGDAAESAQDMELHTIVEQGIERAVGYDIQEASDIAAFIALFLSLRLQPPRSPTDWIKSWLERPDTAAETRLGMIGFQLDESGDSDPPLKAAAARMAEARRRLR